MLPALIREADSELLAAPLEHHLEETRAHAARVADVFLAAGAEPTSAASAVLEGLRRQHDLHVGSVVEPRLRDLFLIDCAVRTEVVEAALYGSLIALSPQVDVDPARLAYNRDEEDAARESLESARAALLERLG